jgi:HEAT repeat protein
VFCWIFAAAVDPAARAQEEVAAPVEPLVETLIYPNVQYYDYALVSDELAARGAEAVGPLAEYLHSSNQLVQLRVLGTLSRIGPDSAPALNDLLVLLRDRDPVLRAAAAECIGALGEAGQVALPDLMLALDDCDEITVGEAARAIGALQPQFISMRLSDLLGRLGTLPDEVRLLPLRTWYRIACRKVEDPALLQDLRKWTLVVHFTGRDRMRIADALNLP